MNKEELNKVLKLHKLWLNNDSDGKKANLQEADLRGADLQGADLDFSCLPLWCGLQNIKIDERIARQLLAHAFKLSQSFCKPTKTQINFMNKFHRIQSNEFPKFK